VTLETLVLEAGERGEIVLCPEFDTPDPKVHLVGTGDFVVEDVLHGHLPAPSVEVDATVSRRDEWSAQVRGVLVCPEQPLKVLVKNAGASKITLRASIPEETE
jgi:hypothetical protein